MENFPTCRLRSRHQQVARMLVSDHSQTQIANALGYHKSTVSRLVRDPSVATEVERLREIADVYVVAGAPGVSEKLKDAAHKSVEVLVGIISDERTEPEIM